MHGQTLHMRAMWPKNGLRTSLAAFAVVGRMDMRRGRPGPRAPSVTVSGEWAKIIGERYVSIGQSLSEPQAMVERCAPTINQARAECVMVAWSACVAMRYGRAACGALWSRYLVALCGCPAMWAAWLWLLSYNLKRRTTNAHTVSCMGACLCCVLVNVGANALTEVCAPVVVHIQIENVRRAGSL